MVNIPSIPIKFRKKIRLLHNQIGPKKFYLKLIKEDPLAKKYIKPSDTQRVIRAYETKLFTKKSLFKWFKNTQSIYEKNDFQKIYIDYPWNELIKRILISAEEMIKKGK